MGRLKINRWKLFRIAAILIVTGLLAAFIRHCELRAAVERYRAELKANGELPELKDALPPPVPDGQNGAKYFLAATALLDADTTLLHTNYGLYGMGMVAPGKAMSIWHQPEIRDGDTTNSWAEIAAALQKNRPALDQMAKLLEHPAVDFKIPYERGFASLSIFTNMHLTALKKTAMYLSAAGLNDLHQGDPATAVTRARGILALADAAANQRTLISELVGMATASYAQSLTWEILQSPAVTDAQLAALQADWERRDFLRQYQNALAVELACSDLQPAQWRDSGKSLDDSLKLEDKARASLYSDDDEPNRWEQASRAGQIFCWRHWWSYPDELRMLRGFVVLQTAAQAAATNHAWLADWNRQSAELDALGINRIQEDTGTFEYVMALLSGPKDLRTLLSDSIGSVQGAFKTTMRFECARQMIITAIALKRCQLKHGALPEHLNDLTPEFLSAPPLDILVNQPLYYRRNADGTFLLYAVGENGTDDGGDPAVDPASPDSSLAWQNPHARDWVWPQPATAAEVEEFYRHLKKPNTKAF